MIEFACIGYGLTLNLTSFEANFEARCLNTIYTLFLLQLSPSLRNRFVEIWCSNTSRDEDLQRIIQHNLKKEFGSGM